NNKPVDEETKYFIKDKLLIINFKNQQLICIPKDKELISDLLHDFHDSPIAGHVGFHKTYDAIRRVYYWPRIAKDTKKYIESCENCQRNKPSNQKPAGLLQPLEIPDQKWSHVSMDFITHLPKTIKGYDAITVF